MSTANVVIQGVTAQVNLRALDRSINELDATRRRFSLLHDLGHHILAEPGANESDISAVFDNLLILTKAEHDHLADFPAALSDGLLQPGATLPAPSVERQPASGLPAWNTRLFVGMAADTWFGADPRVAGRELANTGAVAFRPAVARVVFRVPTGVGSMLVDSWAAMVRAIDSVLAAEFLMRLVVYAGIRCRARARSFALIIIAACQRYGRRSEPDDYASLLSGRNLVSTGSCLLVLARVRSADRTGSYPNACTLPLDGGG
jgi:hypothetical protein